MKAKTNLTSIEELKKKHKISQPVYIGLKIYKKWADGKKVSEKEFLDAAKKFLESSIDKGGE
ncbi:hypothetical protein [Maledivibacter halophilus]|uniref:Uncharacterized protein n=1 Tax=Maledivibacter halophilus TaxID=36842 RepID=A0A1T5LWC0_9FIRM|nr:hypothetical protein [Maledivibacter halophilus]SKC68282.1 hypothetical protein SAMN02194393_02136 [Maledivibacter halophilus]SKC71729.1 hypothetical protein SAMN02194393_02516 [Maledivibacter halophilus]SKC80173.1 hypothetical protein SAMN02194393_03447 [Maledivibacter halophilus]